MTNSREKGYRAMLAVRQILEDFFGVTFLARNQQGRQGGRKNADVGPGADTPEAASWPLFCEVKHRANLSPFAALAQAKKDSKGTGKIPVAIVKRNRGRWTVAIELDHFLELAGPEIQRRLECG